MMVNLTVSVSDKVAAQLAPVREKLPELLAQIAQTLSPDTALVSLSLQLNETASLSPAYTEVLDFLISSPSAQEIVDFKVSPQTQSRLHALLEKNREEGLTDLEQAELDAFEQIEHLVILLKARARRLLS